MGCREVVAAVAQVRPREPESVPIELIQIALVPGSGGSYVTTAAQAASCNTTSAFVAHLRMRLPRAAIALILL